LLTGKFKQKRASRRGALFIVLIFISQFTFGAIFGFVPDTALAEECPADHLDETVTLSRVIDGDTIRLQDGRSVRLIGINTPELAHHGQPLEPMAKEARQALISLLDKSRPMGNSNSGSNIKVGLRYGAERKDRYGRTLAHVFTENGQSVEAALLVTGMGAHIMIPPNDWHTACYETAEQKARQAHEGVWRSIYRPIPVVKVPRDTHGFRVIIGRVIKVGESRRSIWLDFAGRPGEGPREGVAVRISRKDLHYFKQWQPRDLKHRKIIVEGWLYPYKKQLVVHVRHPSAVELVAEHQFNQ
jgi:endonuclease YncB( thermonuclease family)